ncbi:Thoeris anti-defense Tad2 family protein [Xenorhabdus hominickii]|uniref:Uncharacterized protein n=1 Tax=Xenorhabdus hominickii TaxID=351679 RepID=A0A2G0Q1I4_XENHO|nr:MW1434 family type I TA system toxin [Xenorhabdus hominickii]AOM40417.1 hypothetical protein A9255_07390 [Xenorhabdus hominickii]PHM53065.1 hypothetical protein Xhom_03948 [Xenorhabdus hominickii]
MSEVNKLDNKQCPFDPEQYKEKVEINNIAPTGSFPWAMIQLYLGYPVRRNGWNDEYIKLVPGSTSKDGKIIPPQVWMINKNDEIIWTPTQEDLMACDWFASMLAFEVKLGIDSDNNEWGYSKDDYESLHIIYNTVNITDIPRFAWIEYKDDPSSNQISWYVAAANKENLQNIINLFDNKDLYITVDGNTYNLGLSVEDVGSGEAGYEYSYGFTHVSAGAQKLSSVMKQTGKTKRFYCYWS